MTDLQDLKARIAAYAQPERIIKDRGQIVLREAADVLIEIAITRFPRILTFTNPNQQALRLWVRGGRVFGMSMDDGATYHALEGDAGAANLAQAVAHLLTHDGEILLRSETWNDVTRDGATGVLAPSETGQPLSVDAGSAELDLLSGQVRSEHPDDNETLKTLAATPFVQNWAARPNPPTVTLGSEPPGFQIALIAHGGQRTLRLTRTT